MLLKKAKKTLLEIKDSKGLPPLWYALEKLQEGAIMEEIDSSKYAPEFFASELIEAGASPNSVSYIFYLKGRGTRHICSIQKFSVPPT